MDGLTSGTHTWLIAISFAVVRLLTIFSVMPVLADQILPGMARRTVAVAFALILAPVINVQMEAVKLNMMLVILILLKEVFLGFLIGFLAGIPFWMAENVGNAIDNQRGATMGEIFSPLSGSQDSPIGLLLLQVASTLFFVTGSIVVFLGMVYASYRVWPVFSVFPKLDPDFALAFLRQADDMLKTTVLLAAPPVLVMFLATFGLGIINRSAPQLNVFFLSMPVKSALGIFFLIPYLPYLFHVLEDRMRQDLLSFLTGILK